MTPIDYLHIPARYATRLGGLRWSDGFDAVEYASGDTFAFSREIALFLDGYARGGPLIDFAHALHLLRLFGQGKLSTDHPTLELIEQFAACGRPLRNAGALGAYLSRDVPVRPGAPEIEEVVLQLTRGPVGPTSDDDFDEVIARELMVLGEIVRDWPARWRLPPMEPLIEADEFERRVLAALGALSTEELRHWLKHGRGRPSGGDELARQVEALKPRTIGGAFDALRDRPRMAAAFAQVDRLAAAVDLPSRRPSHERLPTGGYTDLSTHGPPERLLPTQFALDPDEFLRRFAGRELLYYHREEPHRPEAKDLIVLLDQGIRTWGAVRLTLTAATVALGRLADRRGRRMLLATTSQTTPIDPRLAGAADLGRLIESSDLSENPGRALSAVLDATAALAPRDIVVLSHPRSLFDPGFPRIAGVGEATRVFTLGVDDRGEATFSERHPGGSVVRSRFRVVATSPDPPRPRVARADGLGSWKGDVEAIGFPFRLARPTIGPGAFRAAFDLEGERLFVVGEMSVIMCLPLDGGPPEVLPRRSRGGRSPGHIQELIGVAGGVVSLDAGTSANRVGVTHYDLASRSVRSLEVGPIGPRGFEWIYCKGPHLLVGRSTDRQWCHRLATGETIFNGQPASGTLTEAEREAIEWAIELALPPPELLTLHDGDTLPARGPSARLRMGGTVLLDGVDGSWRPFRPVADDEPILANRRLVKARCRGATLVLWTTESLGSVGSRESSPGVHVFLGPTGRILPLRPSDADAPREVVLSDDGRRIATCHGQGRITIYDAAAGGLAPIESGTSRVAIPAVTMGADWLVIRSSTHAHLLRWLPGQLVHRRERLSRGVDPLETWSQVIKDRPALGVATGGDLPAAVAHDPARFQAACRGLGLVAVVDAFGQVILLDRDGRLLAMFYAPDHRGAAWMPDGTRLGPPELGGPATTGAAQRIAGRIVEAQRMPVESTA